MPVKNTSISLDEHFRSFAARKVAEGRFGSTGEVIRAGLRLLEAEEDRLAELRSALAKGEASGAAVPFDIHAFLAERRAPH